MSTTDTKTTGTGRLSIPLSQRGYKVVAVDPCREMLDDLLRKQGPGLSITTSVCRMQDFRTDEQFDMAVCAFTVLSYLLDEDTLERSMHAVANSLRPGGQFLIDIPSRVIFQSYSKTTPKIKRSVTILQQKGDIYLYKESGAVSVGESIRPYSDEFLIRYWESEHIMKVLAKQGFSAKNNLTDCIPGTGSQYFLMAK